MRYFATDPVRRTVRGRLVFEARVRRVNGDLVNDRVVTITGNTDMEVAWAAKGAASRLNREARKGTR